MMSMSLPRCRSTIPVANTVERIGLARANAVSSTPTAATPSMRSGCSISGRAVLDDGGHHRSPAHPEIPGHRRHRMPITTDTTTRLLTSPLSPRRPRSDLWMAFGPGLLLTLEVGATPHALDPHQRHRPIPGRQIPHPSGPPVVQPRLRPAHRAPTRRGRRFDRVLDLAVTIRDRQHGHACQPEHRRGTTVLNHLGPFSSCSVTPRIMRPQGRSQAQATNRVTRPLPRFITKSPFSCIVFGYASFVAVRGWASGAQRVKKRRACT